MPINTRIDGPSVLLNLVAHAQQTTIKGNTRYESSVDNEGNPILTFPGTFGYRISSRPTKGSVTIDDRTGSWTYLPNKGYTGGDNFSIIVDAVSLSNTDFNNKRENNLISEENGYSSESIGGRGIEGSTTVSYETRIDLDIEQEPSAASTAGDPYVWPIKSDVPVKLPNTTAVYRMFEQGNTYINAFVDCATAEHKERMIAFCKNISSGLNVTPIVDGFFYQHLFIHSDGHEMMVDLAKKVDSYSTPEAKEYFKSHIETDIFKTNEFNEACNKFTVSWTTSEGIRQSTSILFFANPHIENGITMRTSTLENATGMMIDNYKPKLMKIPSLTTTSYSKLWRRLNRTKKQFHFVDIKPMNERWVYGNKNGKLVVK